MRSTGNFILRWLVSRIATGFRLETVILITVITTFVGRRTERFAGRRSERFVDEEERIRVEEYN